MKSRLRGKILEGYLLTNENPDNLRQIQIPFTHRKALRTALDLGRMQIPGNLAKSRHQVLEALEVMILHLS